MDSETACRAKVGAKVISRPRQKAISKAAMHKWGLNAQLGMLMEECGELIQAANKLIRSDLISVNWRGLANEMADVEIMIDQFKLHIDWENLETKVARAKEEKLLNLERMVAK